MYVRVVKRAVDLLCSVLALIVLALPMAVIACWIKMDSPGPVLFRQKRVGKDRSYFHILKFRTMYADAPADVPTHQLNDAEKRITRSGRFLRRYSLDELPQLFNILVGQMSIVGPRPALWNQDDLLAERDKYGANHLTPGLTGLAQIKGRDELPIPVKAAYDGEYVKTVSLLTDLRIIFATCFSVLRADGVVEGAQESEEEK